MTFGLKMCANDILAEFENGSGWFENMATRGRQFSLYGYSKTLLTLYRPHLFSDHHNTWSEDFFSNEILDEIKNGWLRI